MHAYAATDPIFVAMNRRGQRETQGELGSFCVNCHAPLAVREGATTDGLNLDRLPAHLKGVTCYFCHNVTDVTGTHSNPLVLADDQTVRGPIRDAMESGAHGSRYSKLHDRDQLASSTMCGACHDLQTPHGSLIERTFAEWQSSVFARAPGGATCGQCHMPQQPEMQPIANVAGAAPRHMHGHSFPAVDVALTPFPETESQRVAIQEQLDLTVQSALCVGPSSRPQIHALVENVAAGHAWPSGAAQDRRAWVEVVAYRNSKVIFQSGVVGEGKSPAQTWRQDPHMWLIRDCIFDPSGAEVHMFWQAASFESAILPTKTTLDPLDPAFYQSHVYHTFPAPSAEPDRVTMRIYLTPMDLEIVDDLIASGDLSAEFRSKIPVFEVGMTRTLEWTAATAKPAYTDRGLPFSCVSTTNFSAVTTKVPAPTYTRCKRP